MESAMLFGMQRSALVPSTAIAAYQHDLRAPPERRQPSRFFGSWNALLANPYQIAIAPKN
jgi:hypothetical protein